jgi:hypothetical protein
MSQKKDRKAKAQLLSWRQMLPHATLPDPATAPAAVEPRRAPNAATAARRAADRMPQVRG